MHLGKMQWVVLCAGYAMVSAAYAATAAAPLQLFGTTLKGATRTQLRHVFKSRGMKALREDDRHWDDLYDPRGVLSEATAFGVEYEEATGAFAEAQYTFQSFMDTGQVTRIIALVRSKYGAPSSLHGSADLGEVTARWNLPDGMQIAVHRGWPDTTTYLDYIDVASEAFVKLEMDAARKAELKAKAKRQGNAF